MSKTQFEWLMNRLKHNLKLCDVLRFDHFRGFIAYWQVPNGAKTAKVGHWIRAPAQAFFKRLLGEFQTLPFVAEDLGYITESVKKAITGLGLPGMRGLLFAFDGSKNNPHLPENHVENSVVYTGTHDTNTVKGWFKQEANFEIKKRIFQRVGRKVSDAETP